MPKCQVVSSVEFVKKKLNIYQFDKLITYLLPMNNLNGFATMKFRGYTVERFNWYKCGEKMFKYLWNPTFFGRHANKSLSKIYVDISGHWPHWCFLFCFFQYFFFIRTMFYGLLIHDFEEMFKYILLLNVFLYFNVLF